jgi:hypothetical protein
MLPNRLFVCVPLLAILSLTGCGRDASQKPHTLDVPDKLTVTVSGPVKWRDSFTDPDNRERYTVTSQTALPEGQLYLIHHYSMDDDGSVPSFGHGMFPSKELEHFAIGRRTGLFITAWGPHQYSISKPYVIDLRANARREPTETLSLELLPAARLQVSLASSNLNDHVSYAITLDDGTFLYERAHWRGQAETLIVPAGRKVRFTRMVWNTVTEVGPFDAGAEVQLVLNPPKNGDN